MLILWRLPKTLEMAVRPLLFLLSRQRYNINTLYIFSINGFKCNIKKKLLLITLYLLKCVLLKVKCNCNVRRWRKKKMYLYYTYMINLLGFVFLVWLQEKQSRSISNLVCSGRCIRKHNYSNYWMIDECQIILNPFYLEYYKANMLGNSKNADVCYTQSFIT